MSPVGCCAPAASGSVVSATDYHDKMTGCHDESKPRAAMLAVAVSVEGGTATSTRFGHPEKIAENGGQQPVVGTTLGTASGARSSSLVIHCVTCAETQWQR